MGAVTPETCWVTLQWTNICILLHLVGYSLTHRYHLYLHFTVFLFPLHGTPQLFLFQCSHSHRFIWKITQSFHIPIPSCQWLIFCRIPLVYLYKLRVQNPFYPTHPPSLSLALSLSLSRQELCWYVRTTRKETKSAQAIITVKIRHIQHFFHLADS